MDLRLDPYDYVSGVESPGRVLLSDGTTAVARWVLSGPGLPDDAAAEAGVLPDGDGDPLAGAGFATFADAAAWARRRLGVGGWAPGDDGGWIPAAASAAGEACDREALKADALGIVGACPHPRLAGLPMCRYHLAEAVARVLPAAASASAGLDGGGYLDGSVSVDAQWLAAVVGADVGGVEPPSPPQPSRPAPRPASPFGGGVDDDDRDAGREPRVPPQFTGGGTWDDDSASSQPRHVG